MCSLNAFKLRCRWSGNCSYHIADRVVLHHSILYHIIIEYIMLCYIIVYHANYSITYVIVWYFMFVAWVQSLLRVPPISFTFCNWWASASLNSERHVSIRVQIQNLAPNPPAHENIHLNLLRTIRQENNVSCVGLLSSRSVHARYVRVTCAVSCRRFPAVACGADRPDSNRTVNCRPTGVCERNTPFMGAFALQSCGRNYLPAPDLVLWKLIFQCVFLSGGVFVSQTPVVWCKTGLVRGVAGSVLPVFLLLPGTRDWITSPPKGVLSSCWSSDEGSTTMIIMIMIIMIRIIQLITRIVIVIISIISRSLLLLPGTSDRITSPPEAKIQSGEMGPACGRFERSKGVLKWT